MRLRKLTATAAAAAACMTFGLASSPAMAFFGRGVVALTPFSEPSGVTVDQGTGNVLVTENGANQIAFVGPNGERPPTGGWPSALTGALTPPGSFFFFRSTTNPVAVAVDDINDYLYVSDVEHALLDKFKLNAAKEYEFVQSFTFGTPLGAVADSDGNVYVASYQQGVHELDSTGEEIRSLEIEYPQYLALDSQDNLYVMQYRGFSGRVVELIRNGSGEVESEVVIVPGGAHGIAVDGSNDNLYVDFGSYIEAFNAAHEPVEKIEVEGLTDSEGIAVDEKTGNLYVTAISGTVYKISPPGLLPDVTTGATTNVQATSATLEGEINPDGQAASFYFEYGTNPLQTSTSPAPPGDPAGSGEEFVQSSVDVSELEPNTTYHYRMVGVNANGTHPGQDQTFTTLPAAPAIDQPPSVAGITRTSAILAGTVNPEKSSSVFWFECTPVEGLGSRTSEVSAGAGLGAASTGVNTITELRPDNGYRCRLAASNQAGTTYGPERTLTTLPVTPPLAETTAAVDMTPTAAKVSGLVDGRGLTSTYGFQVGRSAGSYGPTTGLGAIGTGAGKATVTLDLEGLQPGTTYHYRVTASNVDGTVYGVDRTFSTPGVQSLLTAPSALPLVALPTIVFPRPTGEVSTRKSSGKSKAKHGSKRKAGQRRPRHNAKRKARGGPRPKGGRK
jgi:FlaG/FlaF family flagellin (archaellin)